MGAEITSSLNKRHKNKGSMSIPISRITLYNNGYATFCREGEFTGSTSVDLFFRKEDIGDVLKSISFSTEGGNSRVCSVSYQDTKESDTNIAIDIPSSSSITGLLTSLKGVKVSLGISGKTVEGILLGIEELMDPHSGRSATFVSIFSGIGVKSYPLLELTNVDFLDENIQAEIQYSLKAALSQKNRDMLKVTVFTESDDQTPYKIKATYSLMAKEWEPSYRMQIKEVKEEGKCDAILEVFAVVNNTQEEDWEKVRMDIVSGVPPIPGRSQSSLSSGSFPVTVKLSNSSSFTIRCDGDDTVEVIKERIKNAQGHPPAQQKLVFNGKQIETGRTLSDYNIRANSVLVLALDRNAVANSDTAGTKPVFRLAEIDNLSFYRVDNSITVLRSQSALVPILKQDIEVSRVLWYNETMRNGNPLSCIMFSNSTGYTLERGSLVLKQNSLTLGECNLEQMYPKDEELYAYSVQLGVEVTVDVNTHIAKPHFVKVQNGEISIYNYKTQTTQYTFDNKMDQKFGTLMIDHLFLDGWDFVQKENSSPPIDITDRYYRFEQALNAKEKLKFEVSEKRIEIDTYTLSTIDKSTVTKWTNAKWLREGALMSHLEEIQRIQAKVNALHSNIYEVENEIRDCKDVQSRLRSNISVLQDSKSQSKYVTDLAKEEDRLKVLEKTRKSLNDEKQVLNKKLTSYCQSVEFKSELTY